MNTQDKLSLAISGAVILLVLFAMTGGMEYVLISL